MAGDAQLKTGWSHHDAKLEGFRGCSLKERPGVVKRSGAQEICKESVWYFKCSKLAFTKRESAEERRRDFLLKQQQKTE